MFFQTQEIKKEYLRLDGICGIDTTYMPIKRYRQKGKTVAMCEFTSHSAIPIQFMFNLYYLNWLPETDCMDVVRHEYAHAAAALLFGPASLRGSGHGPLWQRICALVDCRPSPYTYNLNVLEPLIAKEYVKGPTCLVQCCRCGMTTEHAEDSRIVKVLKSGLNSWNYACQNCGGRRFRLAADMLEAKNA